MYREEEVLHFTLGEITYNVDLNIALRVQPSIL
jgi:hypothetical protein